MDELKVFYKKPMNPHHLKGNLSHAFFVRPLKKANRRQSRDSE
jgi:hypothetical protein